MTSWRLSRHLFAWVWLLLAGCTQEPINWQCPDPLGSDSKSLVYGGWTCFQEDINNCFRFDFYNGQPVFQSVYVTDHYYASIADIGEKACLGDVTEKPQDYFYAVYAQLHHGYVIKMADGSLGRMYLYSWEKSGDSVVTINIKRQYSF